MTIGYIGDVATALPAVCANDPATGILSDIATGAPCETIMTQGPSGVASSIASVLPFLLPVGVLMIFAVMGTGGRRR
jgi:hypothetical protein